MLNYRLNSERSEILRISSPIKEFWAKEKNLCLSELLSDGPYKERYRKEMIEWSDEMRNKDYGFFCRETMSRAKKEIIIISDIRRPNDIRWFRENYSKIDIYTIRITASDEVRNIRGWEFESGVDDVQSECGLDDFSEWNFVINNDKSNVDPIEILRPLIAVCQ